jgi:hypothetical protein
LNRSGFIIDRIINEGNKSGIAEATNTTQGSCNDDIQPGGFKKKLDNIHFTTTS